MFQSKKSVALKPQKEERLTGPVKGRIENFTHAEKKVYEVHKKKA